jgi:hypothetical protein
LKTKDGREAVYRFSQVPPDVAEAKTQAILRILAEAIRERARIAEPAPAQQERYKAVYSESAVAMATSEHGA